MGRVTAAKQRDTFTAIGALADRLHTFGETLDPAIGAEEIAQVLRDGARVRVGMAGLYEVCKARPLRCCQCCGAAMNGRTDRKYCGSTCRKRAYRATPAE